MNFKFLKGSAGRMDDAQRRTSRQVSTEEQSTAGGGDSDRAIGSYFTEGMTQ